MTTIEQILTERCGSPRPGRVAILRALRLGDMLCAVPALRAFRAAWPDAEIVLIGLPWCRALVRRFGAYLDGFREFPGFPGLPERPPSIEQIPRFLAAMQAERFDLAIQLHGSGAITTPLIQVFGATVAAGFVPSSMPNPNPDTFLPYPNLGLEIRRLLRLVAFLGIPTRGENLEFPLEDADHEGLRALADTHDLRAGTYVCVHPGASVPERRWSPGQFAAVADALADRGLRVVLTGTAAESGLTGAVRRAMRAPAIDLSGSTELGVLAALLAGARLLVSNDTGVVHLAAALRTPSVIIATGDHPARWAPVDGHRHRVLCHEAGIEPSVVIGEAYQLLEAYPPPGTRSEETPRCLGAADQRDDLPPLLVGGRPRSPGSEMICDGSAS